MSLSDSNRIVVESVSANMSDATIVSARVKILPADDTDSAGRMLRRGETTSNPSNTDHSVGLFRQLQSAVEGEQSNRGRAYTNINTHELITLAVGWGRLYTYCFTLVNIW